MRRLFAALAALLLLAPAAAAADVVAHPSVMAQPTSGRWIKDIGVTSDGRLILGHGNYSANTGPIDLAWVDPATGEMGVYVTAPTEELNTFRSFRGHLFAPWIDPTGPGSAVNGGYTTDEGGWRNTFTTPAGHVYDYAELNGSRFLTGAIAYGGAGVWQSDGDGPWRLVLSEESAGGATGWERFYWAAVLGGKVYVQALHKGGTEAQPTMDAFRMRAWDGTRWRAVKATVKVTEASNIETFRDRAFFGRSVFDGRTVRASTVPVWPSDFYTDGSTLWAVDEAGAVWATGDGTSWAPYATVTAPDGSRVTSVAVVGGRAFVGTSTGLLLAAA